MTINEDDNQLAEKTAIVTVLTIAQYYSCHFNKTPLRRSILSDHMYVQKLLAPDGP